jgi:hypothetical protein
VGAVGGAEGVVDEDVGEAGEIGGERRIVRLLARLEPRVFEQEDVTGAKGGGRGFGLRPDDRGNRLDRDAEQLAQPLSNRSDGKPRVELAFRAAEVRRQDHRRAAVAEGHDRRQRGADAGVVGDFAVDERHVEVDPHEDAVAAQIGGGEGSFRHDLVLPIPDGRARPMARATH